MNEQTIKQVIGKAVATLQEEEAKILSIDVSERAICACLAAILKRTFEEYSIHVEYNRHGIHPKEIELPNADGVLTSSRVFPDIIVHRPGHDDANLLVIEVKKTTNPLADDLDIDKLYQLKQQLGYEFAVFLRLPSGPNACASDERIIWV